MKRSSGNRLLGRITLHNLEERTDDPVDGLRINWNIQNS
jgi:hypothetical protein